MTWPLASLLLVAAVLAVGFAWYERSRPPARVVALVAAMAALAALGRIAFAPLPNVKPTTDIVLISGAALGGAPGFAVGALAALASNVFFGQGPWTPFQMLAWGAVGVGGGLLGRLAGARLGRLSLATAGAETVEAVDEEDVDVITGRLGDFVASFQIWNGRRGDRVQVAHATAAKQERRDESRGRKAGQSFLCSLCCLLLGMKRAAGGCHRSDSDGPGGKAQPA